jgi:hypothetical protein
MMNHIAAAQFGLETDSVQYSDGIIWREQHVTYRELSLQLRSSEGTLSAIIQQQGHRSLFVVCSTAINTRA